MRQHRVNFIEKAALDIAAAVVSGEAEGFCHQQQYIASDGQITNAPTFWDIGLGKSVPNKLHKTRAQLIADEAVEIAVALDAAIEAAVEKERAK